MTRLIPLLTAAAFAAGVASPALACSWGKNAKHDTKTMAEVTKPLKDEVSDEAMTTFDPKDVPAFEKAADAPLEEESEAQ